MRHVFIVAWILLGAALAQAATIEQPLADAAKETQARELFHALKCVVCEGQSLADSDAKLAIQMRAKVRELLDEGKSPDEVLQFFRKSYGDHILMQPALQGYTALLWALPLVLLVGGGAMLWRFTRRNP